MAFTPRHCPGTHIELTCVMCLEPGLTQAVLSTYVLLLSLPG